MVSSALPAIVKFNIRCLTPALLFKGYKFGQKFQKQKKAGDPLCTTFLQFIDWYFSEES